MSLRFLEELPPTFFVVCAAIGFALTFLGLRWAFTVEDDLKAVHCEVAEQLPPSEREKNERELCPDGAAKER